MNIQEHYLLYEGRSRTLKTPNVVDSDGWVVLPPNLIITVENEEATCYSSSLPIRLLLPY